MLIGFSGVPGSGKTSTARSISAILRSHKHDVELVSEYARRYIAKYGFPTTEEQFRILKKQLDWEDSVSANIIITDSPIFLGFMYALENKNFENIKQTVLVNDLFKEMSKLNTPPRYDIIFHINPDLKPIKDGVRSEHQFNDEWRNEANRNIMTTFKLIFPPKKLVVLSSIDRDERTMECFKVINEVLGV